MSSSGPEAAVPDRVGSDAGAGPRLAGPLAGLERVTSLAERPVEKLAGSGRRNPLPHAGTISVFLLGVVVVSGLYITLFFEFGYDASYRSVTAMNDHGVQKVVRALHRYSSAMLVITTLIHAWRILVAQRFLGRPRRWRWISGVSALVLVWLTGVTGYWLVWDIRAQALSEVMQSLVGSFGWGANLVVGSLSGTDGGSGSGVLLVIWFLHLALTAVVGWFTYRHLRRTRLGLLPPAPWMIMMGLALLVVSMLAPLEVLAPANWSVPVADMPLDPFVLFLLPPLLSGASWIWLVSGCALLALVVLLPRLLTANDPGVVQIDDEACTGCDLCVVDCPYEALRLVERTERPALAVVDPAACVGCGICVGACAFGAMTLPGFSPNDRVIPEPGQDVVVACDRHDVSDVPETSLLRTVRCSGMIDPASLAADVKAGAASVHVIGCAPGECRFGCGNERIAERIAGERAPRLPRKWEGSVAEDWVALGRVRDAIDHPGEHSVASPRLLDGRREAFVGIGLLVLGSVIAAAFATRAPFHPNDEVASIRVVVDHDPGRPLVTEPSTPVGAIDELVVRSGNDERRRSLPSWNGRDVGVVDIDLASGQDSVEVLAVSNGTEVLLAELDAPDDGERLLLQLRDVPRPRVAADGERVFNARASGCAVCHSTIPGDDGVGPSLGGVASVAGERVPGLDAENYLRQSILLPDQYVLEGWPEGQMSPFYRDTLSEEDLDALIAYLLTLERGEDS